MKIYIKIIIVIMAIIVITFITIIPTVQAGALSPSKVTIDNSRAGQSGVTHTFNFTTGTTGTIQTILMQYCTTPSGSCTVPSGLVTTSSTQGTVTGIGTSTTNVSTNGTLLLTVTSPISVSAATPISIQYSLITNPSSINSSFFVRIDTKDGGSTVIDSAVVAFATLDTTSLTISADVGATFSVAVAPVVTGTVNGQAITLGTTTATSIPFGTLSTGVSKVAAHDITVITNSTNGYVVTIKAANPPLIDGSNNIDNFTEPNSLPLIWSSPAGISPNVNTGFLGYTTEDATLCTGTAGRFITNKWAGLSTTPYEASCNQSAVNAGETTRIGWQVEVNGLQPVGNYTGDVIIVTTPTY